MAESVPRRARFYIESDDDEDYDVFLFYPSRNRVLQRENPSWEWDDNDDWSGVLEHFPSPTYSVNSNFVFPDESRDGGIADVGYSNLFMTGLLAPSCGMSGRVSAFMSKTMEALRSFKDMLGRRVLRRRGE